MVRKGIRILAYRYFYIKYYRNNLKKKYLKIPNFLFINYPGGLHILQGRYPIFFASVTLLNVIKFSL